MWTQSEVEALAPDAGSLRSGRELAQASHWKLLGRNDLALWGFCQGSGKAPYQVQIETSEPAFQCSCPSRKSPCKHGLGLLLLAAAGSSDLESGPPPQWVQDWLAGRMTRSPRKAQREAPADPEARAKRLSQRLSRAEEGVAYLEQWLRDLVRAGIASAPSQSSGFWDDVAARMVDCQVPGLARQLRRIPEILWQPEWKPRLARHLGGLHLITTGFRRLAALPPPLRDEIHNQLGFNQAQEHILKNEIALSDVWQSLAVRTFEEDQFTTRRTWLWGRDSGRLALVLEFSAGRPTAPPWPAGVAFRAELAYFAGSRPERALVKSQGEKAPSMLPPGRSINQMLDGWAETLAANPWCARWPVILSGVVAEPTRLVGSDRQVLAYARDYPHGLNLTAAGGGVPIQLFGEWDGWGFRPLSFWCEGRFYG